MGSMVIPGRMRQQPQQLPSIDWSNPITRGLVGFWLPNGGGFVSAIPGVVSGAVINGELRGGQRGVSVRATGIRSAAVAHSSRWKPTATITVLAGGSLPSSSGYFFGCEQNAGNAGWGMYPSSGVFHPYLRVGNAWADVSGPPVGAIGQFGFCFDGNTFYALVNGVRGASQSISGLITNSNSGLGLNGANDQGDNGGQSAGNSEHEYIAIWDRAISLAESASFYANPWQVFAAPRSRDWVYAPAQSNLSGALSSTLGSTSMSAAGIVATQAPASGAFVSTLGGAVMATAGLATDVGTFASTLAGAGMAANGGVAAVPYGTLASTLAGAGMSAAGSALNRGALTALMADASMSATGTAAPHATGAFASTMQGASMFANGYLGNVAPANPVRAYRWRVMRRHFSNPGTQ